MANLVITEIKACAAGALNPALLNAIWENIGQEIHTTPDAHKVVAIGADYISFYSKKDEK
jgi:hypothetical protein